MACYGSMTIMCEVQVSYYIPHNYLTTHIHIYVHTYIYIHAHTNILKYMLNKAFYGQNMEKSGVCNGRLKAKEDGIYSLYIYTNTKFKNLNPIMCKMGNRTRVK